MASVPVAPIFRPWLQAGISHFLLDPATLEDLNLSVRKILPGGSGDLAVRPCRISVGAGRLSRCQNIPPTASDNKRKISVPSVSCSGLQAAHARVDAALRWPPEWEELWNRLSVHCPHPVIVWTYPELGDDLSGKSSTERRRVLQSLMRKLRMPKGSHAFWPYTLSSADAGSPDIFQAGLHRFNPRTVIIVGDRVVADLACLGDLPAVPLQVKVCSGRQFLRIPDFRELASMQDSSFDQLVSIMASLVK